MTDWNNEKYVAEYEKFRIDNERNKYKLELKRYLIKKSTVGDSFNDNSNNMQGHNNMPFSTFDSDNDMRFYDNCAQIFKSGWWFNDCFQTNLNGLYYQYSKALKYTNETESIGNPIMKFLRNGIHWNSIGFYNSLKSTKLRIRRK